jgi:hypothetical protein
VYANRLVEMSYCDTNMYFFNVQVPLHGTLSHFCIIMPHFLKIGINIWVSFFQDLFLYFSNGIGAMFAVALYLLQMSKHS